MTGRSQPLRPAQAREKTPSRWWHPLTQWWGLFGVIIFIGLVMGLVDSSAGWLARQSVQWSGRQAGADAAAPSDQSFSRP